LSHTHARVRQGWAAARGELDWSVVGPLYASGVAWTLVYDTIYAHQDVKDDARLGVHSTALHFAAATPQYLTGAGAAGAMEAEAPVMRPCAERSADGSARTVLPGASLLH
jgi:4-hydroxybenzoate polyprenyltransferase